MRDDSADINQILETPAVPNPAFPHAPRDWKPDDAERVAREEGVELTEDHWETIRALQAYYARHEDQSVIKLRDLHDALDEHFQGKGGVKYLYTLFPKGPIAQSCRMAGLEAPYIATDLSFGSVA